MLENLHFSYDGKSSRDFGVVLVNPGGGLYKEEFLPSTKIIETTVAGRYTPFLQRVDSDPRTFTLHLYMKEWKERNNLRQIARWLYQNDYKKLTFESNPDIECYAMIQGRSELTHDGLFNGYLSVEVRTNSPYFYSKVHENDFEFNFNGEYPLYNNGDLPMRLSFEITPDIDGGIIIEEDYTGQSTSLTSLIDGEIVYVDGENEIITSSLEESQNRYVQNNHDDDWIEIPPESKALLKFYGSAKVKIKYQYAYLNFDTEMIGVRGACN